MVKSSKITACPCGNAHYLACCGRFITQSEFPATAALLMRSRYSAYVMQDEAYLRATWHRDMLPAEPVITLGDTTKWLGLEIISASETADHATVEFIARYKIAGRAYRLHEVSRFVREPQNAISRWLYVDGSFPNA